LSLGVEEVAPELMYVGRERVVVREQGPQRLLYRRPPPFRQHQPPVASSDAMSASIRSACIMIPSP
jgi:hypothetical protein